MTPQRVSAGALVVLLAVAAGLVGGTRGARAFRADQSVRILSPTPLSTVTAPFTIAWAVSGGQGRRFAVFVDAAPIGPGHDFRDLAANSCKNQPRCEPSDSYLAGVGVYLTTAHEVTVPSLQPAGGTPGQARWPVHSATIVLVDSSGHRRLGDGAWKVEFRASS